MMMMMAHLERVCLWDRGRAVRVLSSRGGRTGPRGDWPPRDKRQGRETRFGDSRERERRGGTSRSSEENRAPSRRRDYSPHRGGDWSPQQHQRWQGENRGRKTGMEAPPSTVVWDARIYDPRVLKLGYVTDKTKWEIHELHLADPVQWSVQVLSEKYQLPAERIQAIIVLKKRLVALREQGVKLYEGATKEFEAMCEDKFRELSEEYNVHVVNSHHRETPEDVRLYLDNLKAKKPQIVTKILDDSDDEDAIRDYLNKKPPDPASSSHGVAAAEIGDPSVTPPQLLPIDPADPGGPQHPQFVLPTNENSPLKKNGRKKKPNKTNLCAFKDISAVEAPTRIVNMKTDQARPATQSEEDQRSWVRTPRFIDQLAHTPPLRLVPPPAADENNLLIDNNSNAE